MKKNLSLSLVAVMLMSPSAILAQDLLDDVETALSTDHLQMEDLDINGKLTPAQRMEQARKRLEERNRQMVDKKIENIRIQQEIQLTKKLQTAFEANLDAVDSVSKKEAAPVVAPQPAPVAPQPVEKVEPTVIERIVEVQAPKQIEAPKLTRVTPFAGLSTYKGSAIDFEAKLNAGVTAEYFVASNITVGAGLNYSTMGITDTANSYADTTNLGNTYGAYFPNGREISFNRTSLEVSSKYFFTMDSKLKPYAGLGLGYNRTNIKYDGNGNGYTYNGTNYGSEGVSSNFVAGNIRLGGELDLSSTVALGLDLGYTKALTSGFGTKSEVGATNEDQRRLENVSKSIEDADNLTINAGVILKF